MNCLLEAAASLWLGARRRVMTEPPEEEVMTAQEGLEQCRRNMEGRERELLAHTTRLSEEALLKKRQGDVLAARGKLLERRRVQKRLERLRHGLDLVDTQLDAIKTSELDKEIMLTLKASTNAMRKAGITLGVQEVENVMSELDEQMREVQDITEVLANPLNAGPEEADLDAELDLLDADTAFHLPEMSAPPASAQPVVLTVPPMLPASSSPASAVLSVAG
jgi:DNA polymerase I-like protein with 3'-5' exonuclease and polymerase domains